MFNQERMQMPQKLFCLIIFKNLRLACSKYFAELISLDSWSSLFHADFTAELPGRLLSFNLVLLSR